MRRFVVFLESVSRGAGVKLQGRRIGLHAKTALERRTRLFVVALGVGLDSRRGGQGSRRPKEESNKHGDRDTTAAFADQSLEHEQADGCTKRPLVALDRTARTVCYDVGLFHFADAFSGNKHRRIVIQPRVEPSRGLGDFLHPCLVEFGVHDLSRGRIADELALAVGDFRSFRRTDADGENADTLRRSFLGCGKSILTQLLTIGNDDHSPGKPLGFAERIFGCGDRRGKIRAALRNDVGVQFVEGGKNRPVIQGERRLQKSRTGECNQPDAVTTQLADQILGKKLGPIETRGSNIGCQHRPRDIDRDDDITSAVRNLEGVVTQTRTGQRRDEKSERGNHAERAEPTAERAGRAGEQGAQFGRDNSTDGRFAALLGPPEERDDQRQKPQGIEHPYSLET